MGKQILVSSTTPDRHLTPFAIGNGWVEQSSGWKFVLPPTTATRYSDAQVSDYARLPRRAYPWVAPVHMTVRACASHNVDQMRGTAGFGFWNQPFMPGQAIPRLPRAAWFFFAGQPSNMALARGVPGYGWKAAILDATRPAFLALAPLAPVGVLLMRIPPLYRKLYPIAQRALGVSETLIDVDWREPHTYTLDWQPRSVTFGIDGRCILRTPYAPAGRLSFVAWLDNQYAVVTPQGRLKFGLVDVREEQWLRVESVEIESLSVQS
ncbi:MAG: hypothetical protein ACYDBJ_02525 [Aggregatilineales bacterium]